MAKPLKVIGGTMFYKSKQVRVIAAVHSMAEMQRVSGASSWEIKHSFCQTGNKRELEVAMAEPGVAFYAPINEHFRSDCEYKRMERTNG